MRATIDHRTLLDGLQTAARSIETRTTMPILSGVLIRLGETLELITTNDDYTLVQRLPLEAEKNAVYAPGAVVLPAKLAHELIRKLPSGPIDVEAEGASAVFRAGALEVTVHGFPPEEFPRLPDEPAETKWHLTGERLAALFRQVLFAVATDQTRPILKGVELVAEGGVITATATDSHRLAQSRLVLAEAGAEGRLVVPGKSVQDVLGLFEDEDEDAPLRLALGERTLIVEASRYTVYFRLLAGAYPDTRMLIPDATKTRAVFDRAALVEALDRAYVIAQYNRNQTVRLTLGDGPEAELFTVHPELGRFSERLAVRERSGEPITLWFNARFLLDALKHLPADAVEFGANGALSPFVVRAAGASHPLNLIVPVKTG
ncbi:MAG: DNA polymerase III subunit beta [Hydrogenibacillus schlegelii]|uniref:Beta sliding clamp n=1 Tax=Hydrogenibacillus schlegelii TaxID=1484 RepID=A0A947CW38_HYDSH|nr:DNA polymerase III subunit beta [Hydrogenibacillus schlegelii]